MRDDLRQDRLRFISESLVRVIVAMSSKLQEECLISIRRIRFEDPPTVTLDEVLTVS